MKKSTKATNSPTPATKPATPAKSAAKTKAAPAVKAKVKANVVKAATKAAPPKATATRKPTKAVVKTVEPKVVVTTITALIDVGFGHTLFIRGEGPGLSWDQGLPLATVSDDKWQITLTESARPVIFKLLVDDISWNVGDDFTVASGTSITLTPVF